jgi:hypothetical protein
MSIGYIYFKGEKIIKMNLEGITDSKTAIEHVIKITQMLHESVEKVLVLVNVKNYMPGNGFLEYSTRTLSTRAEKIKKAAYIGIGKRNKKMYEHYDKFNSNIVNRQTFEDESSALLWLIGFMSEYDK